MTDKPSPHYDRWPFVDLSFPTAPDSETLARQKLQVFNWLDEQDWHENIDWYFTGRVVNDKQDHFNDSYRYRFLTDTMAVLFKLRWADYF